MVDDALGFLNDVEFLSFHDPFCLYCEYRYKGGDYYEFLRRIPYAEAPNYIYKVKKIEASWEDTG